MKDLTFCSIEPYIQVFYPAWIQYMVIVGCCCDVHVFISACILNE